MAFDQTFASAYIDNGTRHKVLGVNLLPFSPWHLFLLQVAESPFINSGQVFLYHLRRAVGICRLRYRNSKTRLPVFPMFINQEKLEKEITKFLAYTNDYLQRPEYSIMPMDEFVTRHRSRSARKPGLAPDVIQLAFDASHGANIPISEAWNMPIGEAYIAQAMHLRRQGIMVDFMTESEREFQAAIKQHMEKRKNGEE